MPQENTKVLDTETSERLKQLGFDPGVVVYVLDDCGLTLDDIKEALFEHTWASPRILVVGEVDSDLQIPMIVHGMRAIWIPWQASIEEGVTPAGVRADPAWYVVGRPLRTHFGAGGPIEVRAYFDSPDAEGKLSAAYVQQVYEPSGADPSTPLRYTTKY